VAIRVRPGIALAASCAIALQAMLVGIATSRLAAVGFLPDSAFVICSSSGAGGDSHRPDAPPTHDPACVLCAAATNSPAIPAAAARWHFAAKADVIHPLDATVAAVVSPHPSAHRSRAPPPAA
jgi:hypothetical protein